VLIAHWQRVTHRLLAALDPELAGLDLSAPEINVLACLADTEQPTVRQLADATGQRPSTLTGVLDRLERRKLVRRRPNPRDRRSTLIELTAPGRDTARQVAEAFERVATRIPAKTAAETQRLLSVLETTLTARPPRATDDTPSSAAVPSSRLHS
jgi:MarR family transcriptional regulator, organic hydroperoxide resistance regulator